MAFLDREGLQKVWAHMNSQIYKKAEKNKEELTQYLIDELAKRNQLAPEFANNIEECTDQSKLYVLPDGMIYAYMRHEETVEGGETPNFTNMLKHPETAIYNDQRYSMSGGGFTEQAGCDSVVMPIPTSGMITVRFRGTDYFGDGSSNRSYVYLGTSATAFTGTALNGVDNWHIDENGDTYIEFTNSGGYTHMTAPLDAIDMSADIITINEPITYTIVEGGTTVTYEWESTGHAFIPADYEDRIVALEDGADALNESVSNLETDVEALKARPVSSTISTMVYAPSPQLPADGSETADFDADNIGANDIYAYIDALVTKYPQYLTRETLGKDASGEYDWNRYTASRRTYDAWVKPTHPAMYAWINGSTVIYSVSVSPRVGDTMYTTAYIGMAYSTVTAVDTPGQTRTVNGLVFSRDKTKDIVPTLVYTHADYNPYRLGVYATWHNNVYNASRTRIGTIASIADGVLTDSNGDTYNRYPMGDADSNLKRLPVLVIGSNEHGGNGNGDPAEPAIISARLIKDLCECRNADNPFLNMLKSEYMIVFCPLINPCGYGKDNGYVNANGVNLDRNFDTPGWGNDTDTRHGAYGGSENETQYFMNTLYESGTKIALANHGLGDRLNPDTGEAVSAGMCSYMFGRNNAKYTAHLASIAETMNVNYGLSFYDMNQAPAESYGKTRSYMDHIGVEGGAVEMTAIEGYLLHGGARHTAQALEADYTLLLQFLNMLIECKDL